MNDKEFKRLNRSELVEIIYQLQLDLQKLTEENAGLKQQLESKELKLSNAGSIAEASLGLYDIFNRAQEAADLYLAEVHRSTADIEAANNAMIAEAKSKADALRSMAEADIAVKRKESEQILLRAQMKAKQIVSEAEQIAAVKLQTANDKIDQLLKAHAELTSFLQR